jgi:dienelactone hydrolase
VPSSPEEPREATAVAHVLLFHHALGLTPGVEAFADDLRERGHQVTLPDLYDGATFATVDEGVAHAELVGSDEIVARGVAVAEPLPPDLVYAGFSLGVLPAQRLAQTRPGARAAILYHGGLPLSMFGTGWPPGVPLQLHVMDQDPWGDLEFVEELARTVPDAERYLYPGWGHLFTDRGHEDHDPEAAALVLARTLELLDRVDRAGTDDLT